MERKLKNIKNIGSISPIKSKDREDLKKKIKVPNKNLTKNLNKTTDNYQSNKSTNFQTTKTSDLGKTSSPKPDSHHQLSITTSNLNPYKDKYPKNINEYKHLFSDRKFVQADLDWTLDLRSEKKRIKSDKQIQQTTPNPPSFYEEDLKKTLQNKEKNKLTIEPFLKGENTFKYDHLVTDNHNIMNSSLIDFETSLRIFNKPQGVVYTNHNSEWKNLSYFPKNKFWDKYLPPVLPKNIENMRKNGKMYIRPYQTIYNKQDNWVKKNVAIDENSTINVLGEHISSENYTQRYKIKNINSIRHLLNSQNSNSDSLFTTGLRNGGIGGGFYKSYFLYSNRGQSENKNNSKEKSNVNNYTEGNNNYKGQNRLMKHKILMNS